MTTKEQTTIKTKEEFVRTRNGMKIQTIALPGKDKDSNQSENSQYILLVEIEC